MGVALCAVGVASRAESLVHVVTVQDGLCSVVIPTKPHQPLSVFRRSHLGRKERSFQPNWFAKWPFCSYIMMNQKMLFFVILV